MVAKETLQYRVGNFDERPQWADHVAAPTDLGQVAHPTDHDDSV
jgi:hypothetical protein